MLRALVAIAMAACAPSTHVRETYGPAFPQQLGLLAAKPIACVAQTPGGCTAGREQALATATRIALESAGWSVIDTELVNAERRVHRIEGSSDTIIAGTTWRETSLDEQLALVTTLGARGWLDVAAKVGRAAVTVTVQVSRLDGVLAWARTCTVEYWDDARALEIAAGCAVALVRR